MLCFDFVTPVMMMQFGALCVMTIYALTLQVSQQ